MNNKKLTELADSVGVGYGCKVVEAKFFRATTVNLKYSVDYFGTTYLKVSDLLKSAPAEVLKVALDNTFRKYKGLERGYSALKDYCLSDEFIEANRPKVVKRMEDRGATPIGRYHDLHESVRRLIGRGLVSEDEVKGVYFTFMNGRFSGNDVRTLSLLKLVALNFRTMDLPNITEEMFDMVVYVGIKTVSKGRETFVERKGADLCGVGEDYPDRDRLIGELKKAGVRI